MKLERKYLISADVDISVMAGNKKEAVKKAEERKNIKAHRFSYKLHKGKIPPNMVIDHICRIKNCVNPKHLRIANLKQNALENSHCPAAINSKKNKM